MSQEIAPATTPYGVIREINLRQLLSSLYSERLVILGSVIFFLALDYAYLKLAEPLYVVDASIQVESQSRGATLGGLDAVSGIFQVQSAINTEFEILNSRLVLGRVVDDLGLTLHVTPKSLPIVGNYYLRKMQDSTLAGTLRQLGGYPSGHEFITVSSLEMPSSLLGQPFKLKVLAQQHYELYDQAGRLEARGIPGQVAIGERVSMLIDSLRAQPGSIFIVSKQPRAAAIDDLFSRLELTEKGRYSGIIELKLTETDAQRAVNVLNRISTVYVEQNTNRRQEDAKSALTFIDKQLPDVQKTLQASESNLSSYQQKSKAIDATGEASMLMSNLQGAQSTLANERQTRDSLLLRYTAKHPLVVAQDQKIATIEQEVNNIKSRISSLPRIQEGVTRLTRDLTIKNELYGGMVSDSQQLKVAKASKIGNVRIIDAAQVPLGPTFPMPGLLTAIAFFAGLAIGLLTAIARLVFRGGIKDAHALEQRTGIPVYAIIPHTEVNMVTARRKRRNAAELLVTKAGNDQALESLRSLRTALRFALLNASSNRVLITGPAPGVGKSFVAANLATVLAQSGQRILLIDADLRKGRLHDVFKLPRSGGFSELLAGSMGIDQAIKPTSIEGLDFISTGILPPNPAELLMAPAVIHILDTLSARYDLVLFDSAPVLPVTDSALLGAHTPVTLIVVHYDATTQREFDTTVARLRQAGVSVKGALLNNVTARFDAYGYGYGYTYAERS